MFQLQQNHDANALSLKKLQPVKCCDHPCDVGAANAPLPPYVVAAHFLAVREAEAMKEEIAARRAAKGSLSC